VNRYYQEKPSDNIDQSVKLGSTFRYFSCPTQNNLHSSIFWTFPVRVNLNLYARHLTKKYAVCCLFSFLFLLTLFFPLHKGLSRALKLMEIYMCCGPNIQRGHIAKCRTWTSCEPSNSRHEIKSFLEGQKFCVYSVASRDLFRFLRSLSVSGAY
jgi:hypothetical protein